jgi:hypothetical protein
MALNVKLLRKVKRHILEEPKRFNMDTFVIRKRESLLGRITKKLAMLTRQR